MLLFLRLFVALSLVGAGFQALDAADSEKVAFHVQLIRGTDSEKPENPNWKAVGPKLEKNLRSVFRWKHYWEVGRKTVTVEKGKVSRFHMDPEREIEIKLIDPPK